MKKCINCGAEGDDGASFCTKCGGQMEAVQNLLFCPNCGTKFADDSKFCSNCGFQRNPSNNRSINISNYQGNARKSIIEELSGRVRINGIIWICVGTLQIILGLWNISAAIYFYNFWVNSIILCVIGGLNLFAAYKDLKYSKEILRNPQGILKKYSPLTGAIITLVWNCVVAIWGILGVVGVVGSIYYLVGVRGFVMENKEEFGKCEENS